MKKKKNPSGWILGSRTGKVVFLMMMRVVTELMVGQFTKNLL